MKMKKILAAVLAGAMAVTTMAVSSITVSAASKLISWTEDGTDGTAPAEKYTIDLLTDDITPNDVASVSMTFSDVTTDYLQIATIANFGDGVNENMYIQGYFNASISNGKATLDVTLGVTPDKDGVTNTVKFNYDTYTWAQVIIGTGWMNAGTASLESVILKDATGNVLETYGTVAGGETEDDPSEDTPATTSTVLWEGTQAVGNWENWVQIDASKFEGLSTGKLVVTITETADAAQWGIRDGEWNNILDYSDNMAAGTTSFEYTVSASDIATFQSKGMVLAGHDFTITKVEYISDNAGSDEPTDEPSDEPVDEPVVPSEPETPKEVAPQVVMIPANSFSKFEIVDSVTGDAVRTSMASLAKDIGKLEEGGELNFSTGSNIIVLRKKVIKALIDNKIDLTVEIDGITFIIESENLAKAKAINFRSIRRTDAYKKLVKETDTIAVSINAKGKVEISAAE